MSYRVELFNRIPLSEKNRRLYDMVTRFRSNVVLTFNDPLLPTVSAVHIYRELYS